MPIEHAVECPTCGIERIGGKCLTRWCDKRHESVDKVFDE